MRRLFIVCGFRAGPDQPHRKVQLEKYLAHMKEYMKSCGVAYTLMVVEQNGMQLFNLGKLFNIAYIESKKLVTEGETPYFCFQNVDIVPVDVDYAKRFVGIRDINGWEGGVGSMFFIDDHSFLVSNGYPNDLWGWGGDDSALLERARLNSVPLDRTEYNCGHASEDRNIRSTNEHTNSINRTKVFTHDLIDNNWKRNGLNTCQYSVQSVVYNADFNYYHYLVNL